MGWCIRLGRSACIREPANLPRRPSSLDAPARRLPIHGSCCYSRGCTSPHDDTTQCTATDNISSRRLTRLALARSINRTSKRCVARIHRGRPTDRPNQKSSAQAASPRRYPASGCRPTCGIASAAPPIRRFLFKFSSVH
jgi:hypothetical protein